MDEAGRMELIRGLCSVEGRGPGTDAERRAANWLAERLKRIGRRAEIEPTHVHPQFALVHALHCALAVAGSVVSSADPEFGFPLVLLAAASAYLDLNTGFYLARRLFFRRASQNVVSPGANPGAPLRVILVAHYDAGRSGFIFGERSLRIARRLSPRARVLLGPFRLIFWGGIVPLLPIIGAQMAGFDPQWLQAVQLVPTLLLMVAFLLLIDIALSDTVPGAYDNASGVATVLSAAEELGPQQTPNLDVWVVLGGGEEALCEGMRSFVRAHRKELDKERTVVINVDGSAYGTVHYEQSEGAVISTPMDPGLIELCEALSAAGEPGLEAKPVRSPLLTDALPFAIRGYRAITITALQDGLVPPWCHTHDDVPERINPGSMTRTTEFVVGLGKLLDREAGRAA